MSKYWSKLIADLFFLTVAAIATIAILFWTSGPPSIFQVILAGTVWVVSVMMRL